MLAVSRPGAETPRGDPSGRERLSRSVGGDAAVVRVTSGFGLATRVLAAAGGWAAGAAADGGSVTATDSKTAVDQTLLSWLVTAKPICTGLPSAMLVLPAVVHVWPSADS